MATGRPTTEEDQARPLNSTTCLNEKSSTAYAVSKAQYTNSTSARTEDVHEEPVTSIPIVHKTDTCTTKARDKGHQMTTLDVGMVELLYTVLMAVCKCSMIFIVNWTSTS